MHCLFVEVFKAFHVIEDNVFFETSGGTVSDTPNAIINKHLTMVRGSTRIPAVLFCRLCGDGYLTIENGNFL